mmetsp:Transcript_25810/g.55191  ORF Transcript_25810/g.55191 Transcript_25810/m.55191 type:complete len:223 (+) Transcript_25810:2239-2907(+)
MLKPAFADVSMYCKMLFFDASLCCNLFNFVAISSRVKQRSPRSLSQLVATMKIHTSSCSRISETSLTHFWIESNCVRDETWNAMMAMWQSRMYEGMLALNRSCPDVSHTCRRMSFFPGVEIVFVNKSTPSVASYSFENLSSTARRIMDVLPEDSSPKRTTLNFGTLSPEEAPRFRELADWLPRFRKLADWLPRVRELADGVSKFRVLIVLLRGLLCLSLRLL